MAGLPPGEWDPRIRDAVRILENEQTPLPTTEAVAARIGLSTFHFARQFKLQVGTSPQDYARSFFMEQIASRLRYDPGSIDMVALDFGYADVTAFNRAFKRRFGAPPGRWQTMARAEVVDVSPEGVRLERIDPFRCLARRYFGPRSQSRAIWTDFLDHLPSALRANERIGLAYDDPRITPPERLRYDCAVILNDADQTVAGDLVGQGFEILTPPEGVYAVVDATGLANIGPGYMTIVTGWLPKNPAWAAEGDPFIERFTVTPEDPAREPVLSIALRMRLSRESPTPNMTLG